MSRSQAAMTKRLAKKHEIDKVKVRRREREEEKEEREREREEEDRLRMMMEVRSLIAHFLAFPRIVVTKVHICSIIMVLGRIIAIKTRGKCHVETKP